MGRAYAFDAGPDVFNQIHAGHEGEQQQVPGTAHVPQILQFETRHQSSGVSDFHPIPVDIDLNVGCGTVVPMDHGI